MRPLSALGRLDHTPRHTQRHTTCHNPRDHSLQATGTIRLTCTVYCTNIQTVN